MTRNHFFILMSLLALGLSLPACQIQDRPSSVKPIDPKPESLFNEDENDEGDEEEQSGKKPEQEEEGSGTPTGMMPDAADLPDTDTPPPVRGNLTHGQVCTGDLSCQAGMRCLKTKTTPSALCYKTCPSRASLECGAGTGGCCNNMIGETRVCNLHFACDPVGPTAGCDAGMACYFLPCENDLSNVMCTKVGKNIVGQACTYNNDCKPGLNCVNLKCRKTCRLNMPSNGGCAVGICIPRRIGGLDSTTYGYCPDK